jgi:oligosaccharide repeat unit polymerase
MTTDATSRDGFEPPGVAAQRAQLNSTPLVSTTLLRKRHALWLLEAASLLLLAWATANIFGAVLPAGSGLFEVSVSALAWLTIYLISTTWAFGTPYLLTTAYVIPLMLFHFGLIAQDGLGVVSVDDYHGQFGSWILLAGWYTNLALGCLGAAFAGLGLIARAVQPMGRKSAVTRAQNNINRLRNLGIGLLLASAVFFAIGIAQVGNPLNYDRDALFFGDMDIRGVGVFVWALPTACIALVISAQTSRQKRWSYGLAMLTGLAFLLAGNRSTVLFPFLVGAVLWVKSGRRIPPLLAAGLVGLTLIVIPTIATLRAEHKYGEISVKALAESSSQANVSSALSELGGSASVLATTLEEIPAQERYRYGSSYLSYLLNLVPNIGFNRDRSKSADEIIHEKGAVENGSLQLSPADWASIKILGIDAAVYQHAGVGFSAIAEPYFNFGIAGVVTYFTLLGVCLARMERSHLLLEYRWLIFASLYYWFLLLTVRNQFGDFTKPASFIASSLLIWIVVRPFTRVGTR